MIWVTIVVLALLSGMFSSSETALFKLNDAERAKAPARITRLLADPQALLVTILLANLVVNLAFFAIAPSAFSGLVGGADHPAPPGAGPAADASAGHGGGATLAGGFLALVALLVAGEIVPKALALRMPLAIAKLTTVPIALCVVALSPVRRIISSVLEFTRHVVGETERSEQGVTPEALAEVLERSRSEGVLDSHEAGLLTEIVELEHLRVREAMTPRVDLVLFDLDAPDPEAERQRVVDEARRGRITWIPAIRGSADQIAGGLEVRDLLVHGQKSPHSMVMPVKFVPEVARLVSLMSSFHLDRVSEAVVIDEWGGTAGVVTLEDVFEELVGELRVEGEEKEPTVVGVGEGRYRVSGGLSVRAWNETFGVAVVPDAFETVGGFVSAILGRLPKAGDEVDLGGGIIGEVDEVRGRRVLALTLRSRSQGDAVKPRRRDVSYEAGSADRGAN